jgi:hypothetical protein
MDKNETFGSFLTRGAHALDRLDDRQLADIGLERDGNHITDAGGRLVRRLARDVGFERALGKILGSVHRGLVRSVEPQ